MKTQLNIKPIQKRLVTFGIIGTSPLIQHKWSEKSIRQIRDKHAGKKTKNREIRDPKAEFEAASHRTKDGSYAIPAGAIRKALISVAHKDNGIEKTLVKRALFVQADEDNLIAIDCDEPIMREDYVSLMRGGADLRYRPEFKRWSAKVSIIYDSSVLRIEDILTLVEWAGFGAGLGEWRPSSDKGGDNGRFDIDTSVAVTDALVEKPIKLKEVAA